MKLTTNSTLLGFACLFAFFLFAGLECNNEDEPDPNNPPPNEDDCGAIVNSEFVYADLNNFALPAYYHINGEHAVYTFSVPTLEDVCPLKHIKMTLEFTYKISELSGKAEILYGIFYSYIVPHDSWKYTTVGDGAVHAKSIVEFGIKPSFGTDPGWYKPYLELSIKSTGNEDEDHKLLHDNVKNIKIKWEHYKYKEPVS